MTLACRLSDSNRDTPLSSERFCVTEQINLTLTTLQTFREHSQFTDVIICAGDEEIPCHKAILAAGSSYFKAMFSSPYREQQRSRVELVDVCPWAFRLLLTFAYTGTLELSVNTVQDVFQTASLLDYPLARSRCEQFMRQRLSPSNCLAVELLADIHELKELGEAAHTVGVKNFHRLLDESDEWVTSPHSLVLSYLNCDELDVPSEEVVWRAISAWVEYDPDSRLSCLSSLLSCLRLRHLSPQFVTSLLQHNRLIQESADCRRLLTRRLASLPSSSPIGGRLDDSNLHGDDDLETNSSSPRPSTVKRPTLVTVGGFDLDGSIVGTMQALSPTKLTWQPLASLPVDNLVWFTASVVANVLYVVGGIRAGRIMSHVYAYSPQTNIWSKRADLPQPRARHAAIAVGQRYLLVSGGLSLIQPEQQRQNVTVNASDLVGGDLPINHSTSVNTSVGGQPSLAILEEIVAFDTLANQWISVGRANEARLESRLAVLPVIRSSKVKSSDRRVAVNSRSSVTSDNSSLICGDLTNHEQQTANNNYDARGRSTSQPSLPEDGIDQDAAPPPLDAIQRWSLIELGGVTQSSPNGTDLASLYSITITIATAQQTNGPSSTPPPRLLTVTPTGGYIRLPHASRYVNAVVNQTTNLIYILWESIGQLSVLDLDRNSLHTLASPPSPSSDANKTSCHVHSGLVLINNNNRVGHNHHGDDNYQLVSRSNCSSHLILFGGYSQFTSGDYQRPTAPCNQLVTFDPGRNAWWVWYSSDTQTPYSPCIMSDSHSINSI